MTAAELFYSFILALVGGLICILVCNDRKNALALVGFFQLSFWMRWSFAYLNLVLNFWVQKDLSDMSLGMLDQPGGIWALFVNHVNDYTTGAVVSMTGVKFFIEAIVNLPALRLLEESISMLILTDCFIGAIAGVIVFAYLTRIFDSRIGAVGFLLTSLYPAAVNFSIFALRDLFIYLFLLINICSFAWILLRKDYRALQWSVYLLTLFCVLCLRLALLPFVCILPGWIILLSARKLFRRFHIKYEKMFIITVIVFLTPIVMGLGTYFAYVVVLKQVGIAEVVSPDVLLVNYAQDRYNRPMMHGNAPTGDVQVAGSGAGSDVLPQGLFMSVPLPVRLFVQEVGMFVVPMPWLLLNIPRWLGVFDSVFVAVCLLWATGALRLAKTNGAGHKLHQYASVQQYPQDILRSFNFALVLSFWCLMICFGMLVSNSGNAFRMRLSCVPYLVIGASIYFSATYSWIGGRFMRTADKIRKKRKPGFFSALKPQRTKEIG